MTARRPRIAYLTGQYPRATDTFIQREVAGLRSDGFDVDTFAVRRTGDEHMVGPEQIEGRATTTYLLELIRSSALVRAVAGTMVSNPARLARAGRLAWSTKRAGIRGTVYQAIYLAEALVLGRELRRRDIDHLHNHFGDSSCTVAMLASAASGIPFSFTLHGPHIFFDANTWRLDAKIEAAAFVSTISNFARSQAAMFVEPATMDQVHIIHCGVEPARLPKVDHEGPGRHLVFVGRVVEQKGLGQLFEAMRLLVPERPDLTLTVVGDGPHREMLIERTRAMGLGDRVDFVGARSQAEVAGILSRSDVFSLPSYAEGVPVVIMEALGAGVPVVSTYVGGIVELVEDGVNGYLVPPGDPRALADRLARLLDDPELRNRMGQAGRTRVVDDFDSQTEARRLGSLFIDSLAGRPSPIRPDRPEIETGPLP